MSEILTDNLFSRFYEKTVKINNDDKIFAEGIIF